MIKKIVIVGGGFAGWYTAATLQHNLPDLEVLLVDSAKHPTIGVGETTGWDAPINFKRLVGMPDETQFMFETGAIYKFGSRAVDFFQDHATQYWGKIPNLKISSLTNFYNDFDYPEFDEPWNHSPGDIGAMMAWLSINQGNNKTFEDLTAELGEHNAFLNNANAPFNKSNKLVVRRNQGFAYNIDAEKTSAYLKKLVLARDQGNFTWVTSTVMDVKVNGSHVSELVLENGDHITADLFIDASGLQRVLMSRNINDSWQADSDEYCDSAWVVPSAYTDPQNDLLPISEFFGEDWGWRFKVRLYHRTGNGYVFNSKMVDPEIPKKRLLDIVGDSRFVEPRLLQWKSGQYLTPWQSNLLPLGMAAAFTDPYDAPTFDAHSKALDDLVDLLSKQTTVQDIATVYNHRRSLTQEERKLRLDLTFGLSQRRGAFWDSRRKMAVEGNYLQLVKDIVLGNRKDLESRMTWHWHHIYIRLCVVTGVDMSQWNFPAVSEQDTLMAKAFFAYNRQRNNYMSQQQWPNYRDWLQQNRFGNLTQLEVLQRLNPGLIKNDQGS
jgi:tryptophan halogenase